MYKKIVNNKNLYKILLLFTLFSLIFTTSYAFDNTYYVSKTDCSDSYEGTISKPWCTIQKAAKTLEAGDRVIINSGIYNERIIPINSGTYNNLIIYETQGEVKIYGFTINKNYIKINGFEITNNDGPGIFISGKGHQIINNNIHNTNGVGIECDDKSPYCEDLIIKENKISYVKGQGIRLFGNNNLVDSNEISHTLLGNDADGIRFFGTNHVIKNNYLHDFTEIEAGGGHTDCFQTFDNNRPDTYNILIINNTCINADHQCLMASAYTRGKSSNITFNNNICDTNNWQAVYWYNIAYTNTNNNVFGKNIKARSILFDTNSHHGTVINNIFYGDSIPYEFKDANSKVGFFADYNLKYPTINKKWDEENGLWGIDPLFIDEENKNYKLNSKSPACKGGYLESYIGAYECETYCLEIGGTCCSNNNICSNGEFKITSDCQTCCVGETCNIPSPPIISTCQNTGNLCCDSCEIGPFPSFDNDCDSNKVCCTTCSIINFPQKKFYPEIEIEAELGDIISPITTFYDNLASNSTALITTIKNSGSVSFIFQINTSGNYYLNFKVLSPSTDKDSFYIGLNDELVVNKSEYVYDVNINSNYIWDNVSIRGINGTPFISNFDPKIWYLSKGEHKFTIYGRETNSKLDKIMLKFFPKDDNEISNITIPNNNLSQNISSNISIIKTDSSNNNPSSKSNSKIIKENYTNKNESQIIEKEINLNVEIISIIDIEKINNNKFKTNSKIQDEDIIINKDVPNNFILIDLEDNEYNVTYKKIDELGRKVFSIKNHTSTIETISQKTQENKELSNNSLNENNLWKNIIYIIILCLLAIFIINIK
jgi:hypothetical protein